MPPGKGRRNLEATPGPPDSVIADTQYLADMFMTLLLRCLVTVLFCIAQHTSMLTARSPVLALTKQLLTLSAILSALCPEIALQHMQPR